MSRPKSLRKHDRKIRKVPMPVKTNHWLWFGMSQDSRDIVKLLTFFFLYFTFSVIYPIFIVVSIDSKAHPETYKHTNLAMTIIYGITFAIMYPLLCVCLYHTIVETRRLFTLKRSYNLSVYVIMSIILTVQVIMQPMLLWLPKLMPHGKLSFMYRMLLILIVVVSVICFFYFIKLFYSMGL